MLGHTLNFILQLSNEKRSSIKYAKNLSHSENVYKSIGVYVKLQEWNNTYTVLHILVECAKIYRIFELCFFKNKL